MKHSCIAITVFLIISMGSSGIVHAQNNVDLFESYRQNMDKWFEDVRTHNDKVFEGYREQINKEFASYIEREWNKTSLSKAIPYPFKPEPKPIVDSRPAENSRPLPHTPPVILPEPNPQPRPIEPIRVKPVDPIDILPGTPKPVIPEEDVVIVPNVPSEKVPDVEDNSGKISFTFFSNLCKVRLPEKKGYTISTGANNEVANAWAVLSQEQYNDLLVDCLCIRKSLNLCDWAFYQFTQALTAEYFGSYECNDAVVMQVYIMSQLGYKVRMAKQKSQLICLIAFDDRIFSAPYLEIENENFYCFAENVDDGRIQICDYQFPGEQACSARMKGFPTVPYAKSSDRVVRSQHFSLAAGKVATNLNLIKFYDSYPACSWEIQAEASLSKEVKDQLYPSLRRAINNLSEAQAANVLLNFVQTGFEYQTDDEQFGREKSFFGDETFYYPYCDCEDRSILFSILVKDLLGMDVVLLDYPFHIATAVRFNENIKGDYFDIEGQKYIICDPTYIGAPIGKSMPDMLNLKANILKVR